MFELEVAIRDWRERLTESLRDGDLDELEGHLREEITQLCTQGLSTEDAFVIGTRRLGGEHELCGEFAKVHPRAAAVRQFQWMIIGFLGISVLLSAFRALSLLAHGAVAGSGWDTNLAFGLLGLVQAAGLAALVLVLVRVARGTLPTGRRLLTLGLLLFLAHAVLSLPLNVYLTTTLAPSGYGSVLLMTLPGRYASWVAALLVPCILIRRYTRGHGRSLRRRPSRGRHALRWVLGAGLVFVVGVGMGLHAAQRRAGEQWVSAIATCREGFPSEHVYLLGGHPNLAPPWPRTHGGNIFRGWRISLWNTPTFSIRLRQERNFLGSKVEAQIYGYGGLPPPESVAAARAILAAVDVELVVEP